MNNTHEIANFLFEAGRLKRLPRSGWLLAGINHCESVADHSFRVALIGYILALMENTDPGEVVCMCLLHDIPETRLGDIDGIGKKYLNKNKAVEREVFKEQTASMPNVISEALDTLSGELFGSRHSLAANLVSDADKLECFIQALEYKTSRNASVEPFLDLKETAFHTESARTLYLNLKKSANPDEWWNSL